MLTTAHARNLQLELVDFHEPRVGHFYGRNWARAFNAHRSISIQVQGQPQPPLNEQHLICRACNQNLARVQSELQKTGEGLPGRDSCGQLWKEG